MSLVFYCQCCGARFRVSRRMTGRKGRCYRCGHPSNVPDAADLDLYQPWAKKRKRRRSKAVEDDAPSPIAVKPKPREDAADPAEGATTLSAWLKAATLNVGLDALSFDQIPVDRRVKARAASAYDFDADSKPYPVLELGPRASTDSRPAGVLVRIWRREMNLIRRAFRWLHESAFLASVPFLPIMFYGIVERSRGLALFGASFVVALNVGRAAAGLSGLAALILLDGLQPRKMKRPLQRVLEPLLTIGVIVILFTFVPWLSSGGSSDGTVVGRLKSGAGGLGREMTGVLGEAIDGAAEVSPPELGEQARRFLDGPRASEAGGSSDADGGSRPTSSPPF